MNEQLVLLFAQLDVAQMRYARTQSETDLKAVAQVSQAISGVVNAAPYPDWYDGPPIPVWQDDAYRWYERAVGAVHIVGSDGATPTGLEHSVGIFADSIDEMDPYGARALAADLVCAADLLDSSIEG